MMDSSIMTNNDLAKSSPAVGRQIKLYKTCFICALNFTLPFWSPERGSGVSKQSNHCPSNPHPCLRCCRMHIHLFMSVSIPLPFDTQYNGSDILQPPLPHLKMVPTNIIIIIICLSYNHNHQQHDDHKLLCCPVKLQTTNFHCVGLLANKKFMFVFCRFLSNIYTNIRPRYGCCSLALSLLVPTHHCTVL